MRAAQFQFTRIKTICALVLGVRTADTGPTFTHTHTLDARQRSGGVHVCALGFLCDLFMFVENRSFSRSADAHKRFIPFYSIHSEIELSFFYGPQ